MTDRTFHNTEPDAQQTSMARAPGWTSVGTDTPQHPVSTVFALHYGQDADYSFIGLFATKQAAEARVNADLWKYANLGFTDWPTADGMPPEYPEIEQQIVHGAPPVTRDSDLQPRSYEKRRPLGGMTRGAVPVHTVPDVVVTDHETGRTVQRDGSGMYVWADSGDELDADECEKFNLDSRND